MHMDVDVKEMQVEDVEEEDVDWDFFYPLTEEYKKLSPLYDKWADPVQVNPRSTHKRAAKIHRSLKMK